MTEADHPLKATLLEIYLFANIRDFMIDYICILRAVDVKCPRFVELSGSNPCHKYILTFQ